MNMYINSNERWKEERKEGRKEGRKCIIYLIFNLFCHLNNVIENFNKFIYYIEKVDSFMLFI